MINAIILASGYGRRMGKNKLLLPLGGKAVIEYVMDTVLSFPFNDIVLVAREGEIVKLGKNKGIRTILNIEAHNGQSQSVKLGVINSLPSDGYMFFTGDQPFIRKEHIQRLVDNFYQLEKDYIIVPQNGEKRGNPVVFPERFKKDLLMLKGDEGGRAIIRTHQDEVKSVDIYDKALFFDIDTPDDYEYALKELENKDAK